jgi:cysteinyl-tRNA synthetase
VIRFFNTLSGKKETFVPIAPGEVKLYTCGPTVYDYAHVGNYRAYIFEDLLKRFLVFMGHRVQHIMNITDVDDKTIKGANAQGISLDEYTQKYIEAFHRDTLTLGIAPADEYPRATKHIPEMIAIVKGLIQKGFAYEKEGSYYFSIGKFPAYGRLSKINLEELEPGQRADADEYEKESIHDFALWKAKKEGEPYWESEIGPGRPGWHIECSAMSRKYLGDTFDIHCGGVDNIFPHHENEIAQSEAFTGKKFVNYWLHCHHLIRDGEKMAKSKGNTLTIKEILKVKDNPKALRFLLLSTHYRKTLNFTWEAFDQAETALQRINEFAGEVKDGQFPEGETQAVGKIIKDAEKDFVAGLSDDLNISVALTALFNLIKKVNILIVQRKAKKGDAKKIDHFMDSVNAVLAVIDPTRKGSFKEPEQLKIQAKEEVQESITGVPVKAEPVTAKFGVLSPTVVILSVDQEEKIRLREKARAEKNFKLADQLRQDLAAQGILLEDTKDGVRWKIGPPRKQSE